MKFEILSKDKEARRGKMHLSNGVTVDTPVFMPVGTYGAVKFLSPRDLANTGAKIILGNTFHLMLRPGLKVIEQHKGLREFMQWPQGILTDSGGFQVFSLCKDRKITEEGVWFRSPVNGEKIFLSPALSIQAQKVFGSNIVMCFDECPSSDENYDYIKQSMELSLRWAYRSLQAHEGSEHDLFGIIQGGMYEDLRKISVEHMIPMNFSGYALGGLSVGETKETMYRVINQFAPMLPDDKPRYLMGVGTPLDIITAVQFGIDMFDCVMPTRNARNGSLFTSKGIIRIRNSQYREAQYPLDLHCSCYTCTNFTLSYLHHLDRCGEPLGCYLNSLHNIHFYQNLMKDLRNAIEEGKLLDYKEAWVIKYKNSSNNAQVD